MLSALCPPSSKFFSEYGILIPFDVPMLRLLAVTLFFVRPAVDASELWLSGIGVGIELISMSAVFISMSAQSNSGAESKPARVPARVVAEVRERFWGRKRRNCVRVQEKAYRMDDDPDAPRSYVKPSDDPTLLKTEFDAAVAELVTQLAPDEGAALVVDRLSAAVQRAIAPRIPGVKVTGFASGDPSRSKAFGVALPDIEIVINARPTDLAKCMEALLTWKGTQALQKAALRACTDEIVAVTDLKFRRSGFRGEYPKITLQAPASITGLDRAIGVDISVNVTGPLHCSMLLAECDQLDPRAKHLIMLVRQWTRDRGVAHPAKGHLSHYGWTLLVIYFLQVHETLDGFLLQDLKCFESTAKLLTSAPAQQKNRRSSRGKSAVTVAALFKDFVKFYLTQFDWQTEAVSVRLGHRTAASSLAVQPHVLEGPEVRPGTLAPCIEDPFDVKQKVGICMTAYGLVRMHEELQRAADLIERSASIAELFSLWAPPEFRSRAGSNESEEA